MRHRPPVRRAQWAAARRRGCFSRSLAGAGCSSPAPARARRVGGAAAAGRLGRAVPLRRGHPPAQGRRHQRRRPGHPGHQATIAWDGLRVPDRAGRRRRRAARPDRRLHDRVRRAASAAGRRARADPVLVAVVDGRTRRLPLRVEDPGLLRRLHAKACAAAAARRRRDGPAAARGRTRRGSGERSTSRARPGAAHRPGAPHRVRLVDLGGSVLLDLVPRAGRRALPGRAGRRRGGARRSRCCSGRRTAATRTPWARARRPS